jgi:hypothetical protein
MFVMSPSDIFRHTTVLLPESASIAHAAILSFCHIFP